MYGHGIERMGRRAVRTSTVTRGKRTAEAKRTTIARAQARALKYGGQR